LSTNNYLEAKMNDTDFIREVEELYLRLADADTDDLVELAKLAGLDPKLAIQIEMVKVPDATFAIGKYPVTQEQYQAVMGVNPSHFQGNPQNPVESVSYDDAQAFCEKLSQITGKNYRLPTVSEWEYACRAGTVTGYYFGDDYHQLRDYAWYFDNSQGTTHPVGLKLPNAWGLYDMHGNVWEWCQKDFHLRGGSWGSLSTFCRSAFRYSSLRRDDRTVVSGFRVVCDD
jgi:formylglycine-generating enzyme required for sulfatase activity